MDENEIIPSIQALMIPTGMQNDSVVPEMDEVNEWRLANQRVYFIDYDIDNAYLLIDLYKEIVRMNILEKDNPSPEPITLFIHSFGGDVPQAMAFVDLMLTSHIPIITVAMGAAMSSGMLIFLAGKKRFAFEHSTMLIHGGYSSLQGTTDQVEKAQRFTKKQDEQIKEYILSRTSIPESVYNRHKKDDWYIIGDDIIKLGVVDKIVKDFNDIRI